MIPTTVRCALGSGDARGNMEDHGTALWYEQGLIAGERGDDYDANTTSGEVNHFEFAYKYGYDDGRKKMRFGDPHSSDTLVSTSLDRFFSAFGLGFFAGYKLIPPQFSATYLDSMESNSSTRYDEGWNIGAGLRLSRLRGGDPGAQIQIQSERG